jgi:hypothetical protein
VRVHKGLFFSGKAALFRRWSPQRVEGSSLPASENLHMMRVIEELTGDWCRLNDRTYQTLAKPEAGGFPRKSTYGPTKSPLAAQASAIASCTDAES